MAEIRAHKFVSQLPAQLERNAVYFVRVGSGYDQYVTNDAGIVVAYPLNAPSAGFSELAADPAQPTTGQAWMLRTMENPTGTLQAFAGGLPLVTATDDNLYQLSYRTAAGQTVRTTLA